MKFRSLKADEIECRVATINNNGLSLLLYKDARVDQNILDETVGAMNWQRHHSRDNANCVVSIWDGDKKMWIEKEDTGTESFTEREKGLASDSFKRACFNWGIGRELYTAPFIWISGNDYSSYEKNGKLQPKDSFKVSSIVITNGVIASLEVVNTKTNKVVFNMHKSIMNRDQKEDRVVELCDMKGKLVVDMCKYFKVTEVGELSDSQLDAAIKMLSK